jgi:hypothetical protein
MANTYLLNTSDKDLIRLDIKAKIRYLYTWYNCFIKYDIFSEFKYEHINVLLTTVPMLLYL